MKKRILIATLFIFVISLTAIFLTACLTANHHIDVTAGKYLSYLKEGDGFLRAEVDIKSIDKAEFDYYSGKNNVFYTKVDEDISYYSINLTLVTIAGASEEDLVFDAPVSSSNTYRFTFKEGSLYQELLVTFLIGDDEGIVGFFRNGKRDLSSRCFDSDLGSSAYGSVGGKFEDFVFQRDKVGGGIFAELHLTADIKRKGSDGGREGKAASADGDAACFLALLCGDGKGKGNVTEK